MDENKIQEWDVSNIQADYELEYIPKLEFLYTMFGMGLPNMPDQTEGQEHIILHGGRGGGKSESVAQVLILISRMVKTRILCTREIQNSMADSVYRMLEEWINIMGLQSEFKLTQNSIINIATGTDFIFKGLAHSIRTDSLKSLKGVQIVWVEEAQVISMESLEKLDPTIRIAGRKLIYTMNPRTEQDAVLQFFKNKKRVRWLEINYPDNPFCPQVLINQADEMKELDFDRWLHIWMGKPVPEDTQRVILPYSWLIKCIDLHLNVNPEIGEFTKIRDYKQIGGFDVAEGTTDIHDKNALALRRGPVVNHVEEWQIDEIYQSVQHINFQHKILGFDTLYFDAVAVGTAAKSEFDRINKDPNTPPLPYKVYPFKGGNRPYGPDVPYTGAGANLITNAMMFSNAKAQSWWNLRLRLENSMRLLKGLKIDRKDYYLSFSSELDKIDSIFLELAQATFEEDNSGRIKVDKAPGIREIEIDGKKKQRKSPNKADAINYSFAGDLIRGLQAHRPQTKQVKVIG